MKLSNKIVRFVCCSFRGLKVSDSSQVSLSEKNPVDLNAGADLLHKYQTEWQEMHKMAEDNANEAQVNQDCI